MKSIIPLILLFILLSCNINNKPYKIVTVFEENGSKNRIEKHYYNYGSANKIKIFYIQRIEENEIQHLIASYDTRDSSDPILLFEKVNNTIYIYHKRPSFNFHILENTKKTYNIVFVTLSIKEWLLKKKQLQ